MQPLLRAAYRLGAVQPYTAKAAEQAVAHPDERDLFLCHPWDDWEGSAEELHDHLKTSGTFYELLPVYGADQEPWAVRVATDFIDRIGDRLSLIVGVGPTALHAEGLAHARQYADRTVRVLRELGGAPRVAQLSDLYISSLLSELRDQVAVRGDRVTGPLARLVSYDAVHGTDLVQTLRAWLDAFGDVNAAAAVFFVHPNTFRYRLRRLAEVGELDLANPDARFAALLQLRSFPITGTDLHRVMGRRERRWSARGAGCRSTPDLRQPPTAMAGRGCRRSGPCGPGVVTSRPPGGGSSPCCRWVRRGTCSRARPGWAGTPRRMWTRGRRAARSGLSRRSRPHS
ncbi:helix-turn-helix domain-containing protein [Allobranchiibius sp. GilTou38]|nr:helix-turn-helix domain-containing protein [Allobranchiibius sp. GilTou38]